MQRTELIEKAIEELNELSQIDDSRWHKRKCNRDKRNKFVRQVSEKYKVPVETLKMIVG